MSNGKMKAGGAGLFIMLIGGLLYAIFSILAAVSTNLADLFAWSMIGSLIGPLIMGVGALLVGFGGLGIRAAYGHAMGLATGIIGIIAGICGIISGLFVLIAMLGVDFMALLSSIFAIIFFIMAGVALILLGVTFLLLKAQMGVSSGLTMAAAIMGIIAGAALCSIIGSFFGIAEFILVPSGILMAMVLFKAQ